jgi:fatty acid synthase
MKESDEKENVWLIANDSQLNGVIGLINCLRLEPGGETLRCLLDFDNLIKFPLNFGDKPLNDILSNDLAINVLKNGKIGTYRHLILPKDYDKTESNEYFLNTSQNSLDLSSLQWVDSRGLVPPKHFFSFEKVDIPIKVVKFIIYSAGLNFKDVMVATGMALLKIFIKC